ncbi:hypothetical protein D9615_002007 [Tricholomella constricta]|uniref:DUF6699 domain-containing protein n=1 Tax=Tricholomella constricta TaxID=117010 RepID=A0A8H5M9Y8_9AGAR|nr:hypothetical protein D9615_002007 [Tricholomella constricta]
MAQAFSPFIPRIPTPRGGAADAPAAAPVIPDPPGAPVGWASTRQSAGGYPNYPTSPYTPGFIPNIQPHTPASGIDPFLPPVPGAYYPIIGPPTRAQFESRILPNGFSADYTGYPPPTPHSAPQSVHPQAPLTLQPHTPHQHTPHTAPPTMHPNTPYYGPPSAPLPHLMAGWPGPLGPQYPQSANPYGAFPGAFPHQGFPQQGFHPQGFPQPAFPGWGPHATPAGPPMLNFDGWGGQTPGSAGPTPGWPTQAGMVPPPHNQPRGPPQIPEYIHTGRSSAHVGDRVDPFMAGGHYGPVLEPFLSKVVDAKPKLNPLLEPLPDNGAERPHLRWNMLFESNDCQRSTDASHISWSAGRDEPATYPRLTSLNIVSEAFPWLVEVVAENADIGVTCGEVIDALSDSFQQLTPKGDYEALGPQKRTIVGEAYHYNRSRMPGVPGGRLKQGMRRLDFLGKDTVFGGIYHDERTLHKVLGAVLPCTFVLKCVRRYALTAEEIHEHEERQRAKEAEDRRKQEEDDITRLYTVDTEALNHVLMNTNIYQKPEAARYSLSRIAGAGVIVVEGDKHKQQRKVMNPAFGPSQIRELTEIFVAKSLQLRDIWAADSANQGFNYRFDALNEGPKHNELNAAYATLFHAGTRVSLLPMIKAWFPFFRFLRTERDAEAEKSQKTLTRIGNELLRESKASIHDKRAWKARDLLSLMVQSNIATDLPEHLHMLDRTFWTVGLLSRLVTQSWSDQWILSEVPTFLVAGHETTSTGTTWALYALTQNKSIQDRLRKELLTVDTDNPTMDQLNALPYLDMVVRETMRLHAPVPFTIREATKDDITPLNKPFTDRKGVVHDVIKARKGQAVHIPILAMNHNTSIWGEDVRTPRFSDLSAGKRSQRLRTVFLACGATCSPSLAGPRACIRYRFSLVEMKALLFTLVRAFEFDLAVPAKDIIMKKMVVQRPALASEPKAGDQLPLLIRPVICSS